MTKQEVIELFGQSVYEIWLRVAIAAYGEHTLENSFKRADDFLSKLLEYPYPTLKSK